ncbi:MULTISPECIES: RHS repeat-associated core domain-containing protein [unclassified Leptospira]|uniref:RHS repeat-associated core domain-containing protein n=1 Tax=unclassified Leptospira TaxID=2633828 RepID=UPI0002BF36E0|nr:MULTISPECIES: RHS repeat-associated core domain-containing protein [unclassified Leptospira]EMJ97230.1 RHS repeat-associated core domain protein [Leptospira sp. B5-022]MCR1795627.1 type IV secretion protein Rhs [Leptospira sp. id769339]
MFRTGRYYVILIFCSAILLLAWNPLRPIYSFFSTFFGLETEIPLPFPDVSVNSYGKPGFSLSIQVPPGTGDLVPSIDIQYSGSGSGILGKGWTLVGFSQISKNPNLGVHFGSSDGYTSSQFGEMISDTSGNYKFKFESFSKAEFDGSVWKVRDKNGIIYEYGKNFSGGSNSRLDSDGAPIAFYLDKVRDRFGNGYDIQYDPENLQSADVMPKEVVYARGNARILFIYEDLSERFGEKIFSLTKSLSRKKRLEKIEVYAKDFSGSENLSEVYEFDYDTIDGETFLTSFHRKNFKPILFSYSNRSNQAQYVKSSGKTFQNSYRASDPSVRSFCEATVASCACTADWGCIVASNYSAPSLCQIGIENFQDICTNGVEMSFAVPADVDGDGSPEMVRVLGNMDSQRFSVSKLSSWDTENLDPISVSGESKGNPIGVTTEGRIFPGDFNGDGKTDFLVLRSNDAKGIVYYGPDLHSVEYPELIAENLHQSKPYHFLADVNGDGKIDFLQAKTSTKIQIYLSTGSGFQKSQLLNITDPGNSFQGFVDMDKNGIPDLLRVNGTSDPRLILTFYDFKNGNLIELEQTEISRATFGNDGDQFVSDLNGDGYLDFVFFSGVTSQGTIHYYPFDGRKFRTNGGGAFQTVSVNGAYASKQKQSSSASNQPFMEIDLSGDGIKDRVTYNYSDLSNPYFIVEVYDTSQSNYLPGFSLYWNQDLTQDLNGDGVPDILRANVSTTEEADNEDADSLPQTITVRNFSVNITNITYYEIPIDLRNYLPSANTSGSSSDNAYFNWRNRKEFIDLNGDGRADFLRYDSSESRLIVSYSKTDSNGNLFYSADGDESWVTGGYLIPLDINGDGKPELLGLNGEKRPLQYSVPSSIPFVNTVAYRQFPYESNLELHLLRFRSDIPSGLLTKIENGSYVSDGNVSVQLEYSLSKNHPTANGLALYDPNHPEFLPFLFPDFLTVKLSQKAGSTVLEENSYKYFHSRIYRGGFRNSGYLGFQKIEEKNTISNSITETKYDTPFLEAVGIATAQTKFKNGSKISELYKNFRKSISFNGGILIQETDTLENVYRAGQLFQSSTVTKTYDTYGNNTRKDTSINGTTVGEKITYLNDWNEGILGKPTDIQVLKNGEIISHKKIEYSNFQISAVKEEMSPGVWKSEMIQAYDSYGNPSLIKESSGNSITVEYDNILHKFPLKMTNGLGQVTEKTYNFANGLELSSTDENGGISRTEYDPQGRAIKSYLPGETEWSEKIEYENTGDLENQLVRKIFRRSNGETWQEDLSNNITKISKKRSSLVNGYVLVEETRRNLEGQVTRKIDPYLEGSNPFSWTDFTYDSEGNQVRSERNDGTVIESETDGLISKRRELLNGNLIKETIEERNLIGQVISSTQQGKTTRYSYDSAGRISEIIDPENGTTFIESDFGGRKAKVVHPDSGRIEYEYDPNSGKLSKQKYQNGSSIQYSYDILGRVSQVKGESPETGVVYYLYEYDDPDKENGIGRLTKVTDPLGSTEFGYDLRGNQNLVVKKLTEEDLQFVIRKKYNLQNQIEETVYPDGSIAKNLYSEAGFLSGITLTPGDGSGSDFPIVQYQGPILEDGELKIQRQLGNGVRTDIYYDLIKRRPSRFVSVKDTEIYQSIEYNYDQFGNYLSILDKKNPVRSQNFQYDTLNRLVSASGIYGTEEYTYSDSGKLLQKGNLFYSYENPSHKNAVTRVAGQNHSYQYSYDGSGNIISKNGESFRYDPFQKLKEIQTEDQDRIKFDYDFSGTRIRKTKSSDSSKTISLGGLYEVSVSPGKSPQHTLYFRGNSGDLVAQWTRTDAVLVSYLGNSISASPSGIETGWKTLSWAVKDNSIRGIKYLFLMPGTNLGFLYITILLGLGFGLLSFQEGLWRSVLKFTSPILIVSFSNCSVLMPGGNGNPPWLVPPQFDSNTPTVSNPYEPGGPGSGAGLPVGGFLFLHPDHLGSITMATDGNGNRIAGGDQGGASHISYKPYGEIQRNDSSGPDVFRYKYNGQEEDKETGLYYFKARYYDPVIGRFLQADSVMDTSRPMGMDLYMYTEGNPIRYTDPSGNSILSSFLERNGLGFLNFNLSLSTFFSNALYVSSQRWSDAGLGIVMALNPAAVIGTALGVGAAASLVATATITTGLGLAVGAGIAAIGAASLASVAAITLGATVAAVALATGFAASAIAAGLAASAAGVALFVGMGALAVVSAVVTTALAAAVGTALLVSALIPILAATGLGIGLALAGATLSPMTFQAYLAGGYSKSSFNNINWNEKNARTAACYAVAGQIAVVGSYFGYLGYTQVVAQAPIIGKIVQYGGYGFTGKSALDQDWSSVGIDLLSYGIQLIWDVEIPLGLIVKAGSATQRTCGGTL